MNSGPLPSRMIQVNPLAENEGQLFNWKLRPTLGINSGQPPTPRKIQVNPSAEN